jgi:predicted nuclease of restriction endonuclease-like (RecB) superfamily
MTSTQLDLPAGYLELLEGLKIRVRDARIQAQRTVNTMLIGLYWSVGKDILARQEQQGWGTGVIDRLAEDLRASFPDMKGLSARNLRYMTAMVRAWEPEPNLPQLVANLPWGHIRTILDKAASAEERDWYASSAVQYGWSRNVLLNMMRNRSMERTGTAPSNFASQLAAPDSELAQQVAKDPYNFEFLGLSGEVAERELEQALTSRITETLRELGPGFAFVGRQVHFDVDGDDYYVDMLFFLICSPSTECRDLPQDSLGLNCRRRKGREGARHRPYRKHRCRGMTLPRLLGRAGSLWGNPMVTGTRSKEPQGSAVLRLRSL